MAFRSKTTRTRYKVKKNKTAKYVESSNS